LMSAQSMDVMFAIPCTNLRGVCIKIVPRRCLGCAGEVTLVHLEPALMIPDGVTDVGSSQKHTLWWQPWRTAVLSIHLLPTPFQIILMHTVAYRILRASKRWYVKLD
jgi:hypothetical protein